MNHNPWISPPVVIPFGEKFTREIGDGGIHRARDLAEIYCPEFAETRAESQSVGIQQSEREAEDLFDLAERRSNSSSGQ